MRIAERLRAAGHEPRVSAEPAGAGQITLRHGPFTSKEEAEAVGLFTVQGAGTAADVSLIHVKLSYDPAGSPPSKLKCSTDGGTTFVDC